MSMVYATGLDDVRFRHLSVALLFVVSAWGRYVALLAQCGYKLTYSQLIRIPNR